MAASHSVCRSSSMRESLPRAYLHKKGDARVGHRLSRWVSLAQFRCHVFTYAVRLIGSSDHEAPVWHGDASRAEEALKRAGIHWLFSSTLAGTQCSFTSPTAATLRASFFSHGSPGPHRGRAAQRPPAHPGRACRSGRMPAQPAALPAAQLAAQQVDGQTCGNQSTQAQLRFKSGQNPKKSIVRILF